MIARTDTRKKQVEVDEEIILVDFNAVDTLINEQAGVVTVTLSKDDAIRLRDFLNKKFPAAVELDLYEDFVDALKKGPVKREEPLIPRRPRPGTWPPYDKPWTPPQRDPLNPYGPVWCGTHSSGGFVTPTLTDARA